MLRRGLLRLHKGLHQASRGLHTSQAAQGDSSTLAFPSWLSSGALRVGTPLTDALPGVDTDTGFKGPKDPPPTRVTTLPNGVRIVSEASLVGRLLLTGIELNAAAVLWFSWVVARY